MTITLGTTTWGSSLLPMGDKTHFIALPIKIRKNLLWLALLLPYHSACEIDDIFVIMKIKELLKISSLPVFFASLCCLSPFILVMLGLSTVTFAASLSDILYGEYRWIFRLIGLILLTASITFYLRRQKGICTIDDLKRRRNEVINIIALSVITGIFGYIFFLYVVVHYAGVFFGIWN
mgnify:CR=1 FL=1